MSAPAETGIFYNIPATRGAGRPILKVGTCATAKGAPKGCTGHDTADGPVYMDGRPFVSGPTLTKVHSGRRLKADGTPRTDICGWFRGQMIPDPGIETWERVNFRPVGAGSEGPATVEGETPERGYWWRVTDHQGAPVRNTTQHRDHVVAGCFRYDSDGAPLTAPTLVKFTTAGTFVPARTGVAVRPPQPAPVAKPAPRQLGLF